MNFLIDIIKEESPLHAQKDYEILIYTKGSGIFSTPEKSFEVSPGKIMIIPPGMFHASTSDSVCERIFISGPLSSFSRFIHP